MLLPFHYNAIKSTLTDLKLGAPGADGAPGVNGTDGNQGVKGIAGAKGVAGAPSIKGDSGAPGVAGVAGTAGDAGAPGLSPSKGANGIKGIAGDQGLKGVLGQNGAPGDNGLKGISGAYFCDTTPFNLIIALDGSNSVSSTNFNVARQFVKDLASNLTSNGFGVNYALLEYSTAASVYQNFQPASNAAGYATNAANIVTAATNVPQTFGLTSATGTMLTKIVNQVYPFRNTSLATRIVIITVQSSSDNPIPTASSLRSSGVQIFGIGVGANANYTQLLALTGSSTNVYSPSSYSFPQSFMTTLLDQHFISCSGHNGVPGGPGDVGLKGDAAPNGSNGIDAPKGAKGLQGLQGQQGIKGLQGLTGDAGSKGAAAQNGAPGPTGDKGSQGISGIAGTPG